MNTWYYRNGGVQMGPANDDEMRVLVRAGTVRPETAVWCAGRAGGWMRADAAGLCAPAGAAVPSVPASAAAPAAPSNPPPASVPVPPPYPYPHPADSARPEFDPNAFGAAAGRWFVDFLLARRPLQGLLATIVLFRVLTLFWIVCGVFEFGLCGGTADTYDLYATFLQTGGGGAAARWFASVFSGLIMALSCYVVSLILGALRGLLLRRGNA